MPPDPRLIAFYLPQFHPIPENDAWWGPGFTEWTNVAKARSLFSGHHQPHLPADLGFYDLRLPETRAAQADLARAHGIEAFCYYHYWFAGKRLLERPLKEVIASGRPDFPFCLCWANQTWTGVWHGASDRVLIEQTYPGEQDHRAHFRELLPAFLDSRYVRVNGKPLFLFYMPTEIPQPADTFDFWRTLAREAGLPGLHLVGITWGDGTPPRVSGLDAWVRICAPRPAEKRPPEDPLAVYRYASILEDLLEPPGTRTDRYPCAIPNWDNTPRCGARGFVYHESTPELFERHLRQSVDRVRHHPPEERIVFLKSWNEWAEGNHLEPDRRFGRGWLEAVKRVVDTCASGDLPL